MNKTCTRCGTAKPLSEYTLDRTRADGHFPTCRACLHLIRLARKHHLSQPDFGPLSAYEIAWREFRAQLFSPNPTEL